MKDWPWYYFVGISVLVLAFFFMLYYKPKASHLNDLRDQRLQTEREVAQLRVKRTQLNKLETELQEMNRTLSELEPIIPQEKEISEVFRRIQDLAFNSNLEIKNFEPKGEVNKEFYSDWPIEMDINGSYHNLGRFFARLSNFSRLFTIEDFTIKALAKQTETTTISATCTAKTYILRENQPAEKPAPKKSGR